MTKANSHHLLDILAEVPDFRNNRGKRHRAIQFSMKFPKFHKSAGKQRFKNPRPPRHPCHPRFRQFNN